MSIDKQSLEKIAHLARISIDEAKEDEILADMKNMLAFVEKLQEIDTANVIPLQNMSWEENVLREDTSRKTLSKEDGLKNAPKHNQDYFQVPKVIKS